jgi:hypothetical protein
MQDDGRKLNGFRPGAENEESVHGLAVAEGDAALGEIVGGKFEGDFIASEDADAIAPQAAGQVGEHQTIMFELNGEFPAGEFLNHCALYFDAVFFTHSVLIYSLSQRSQPVQPG